MLAKGKLVPPSRRHRSSKKASSKKPAVVRTLTVSELGHRGDGIAIDDDGNRIFVPFTLAGETVTARVAGNRAELMEIIEPAPNRAAPPCPHFGVCGGCAVQHLGDDDYRNWKRGIVETALDRQGLTVAVDPMVDAHGNGRRRVTLHAVRAGAEFRVGFMRARSHEILGFGECLILDPALAPARAITAELADALPEAGKRLDAHLIATETGLDADVRGIGELDYAAHVALADAAVALDLARIAADGEIIAERRKPILTMGAAKLTPAPSSFLQATTAGEEVLAGLVGEHTRDARQIADLYCGVGPFTLRLAERAAVQAFDNDASAISALDQAVRYTQNLKPIAMNVRDLNDDPLLVSELTPFDAVVIDPPRAGAQAQARKLAASNVPVVVSVSCDPASFARDAAILTAGGYSLERVTPVDQFKYAAHVEVVARFAR